MGEERKTYVAKIAHESRTGQRILRSYGLARSHLGPHEALSPIHEFSREWQENEFIALLGWIEGTPLSEFTGVFELVAKDELNRQTVQIQPASDKRDREKYLWAELSEERIGWQQSYLDSIWGNPETQRLDSKFSKDTNVETPLEDLILAAIHSCETKQETPSWSLVPSVKLHDT